MPWLPGVAGAAVNVDFSKLHATIWLDRYGEKMPTDEERVKQALDHYETPTAEVPEWLRGIPRNFAIDMMRNLRFTDLIRTGGVFVLDPADVVANMDMETMGRGYGDPLPPCPFPRMFFEFWDDESVGLVQFRDLDGEPAVLSGVGIVEVIPCRRWTVYWLMPSSLFGEDEYAIREYELLTEDGLVKYGTNEDEYANGPLDDREKLMWKAIAYEMPKLVVETVGILGAQREPVRVPRQHRRQVERKTGVAFPTIYRVDLRGAGDTDGEEYGGTREYRVRWIVRGHYRREPNGEYEVPGKGRCGWVRAHVKGPAGAPWRGRPIHVEPVA